MASEDFGRMLALSLVPHADSIGLNEQELAFFARVLAGPVLSKKPTIDEVADTLRWLVAYVHSRYLQCGRS